MTSFFSIRLKRRTAFAMLAVWVVTVASGVANACLLDIHGVHGHREVGRHVDSMHASPVAHAWLENGVKDLDDDEASSKESCLKVCDESSNFLPKPSFSFDLMDVHMAPPVASLTLNTASVFDGVSATQDRSPSALERPARIRFLRLAL